MNETIKSKIKTKTKVYNKHVQNGRFEGDFLFLETLISKLNELISFAKGLYYENLVKNNSLLQAKSYWSILKTLYNDKNSNNSTSFDR